MKRKVLVVDDEESIRWVLGNCLEKAGYAVSYSTTGSEAVDSVLTDHFHSIILDITMPDLSGFEVLGRLKDHAITTPVIIITAQNTVKNAIDAMKQGAYDYIAKPFDLDDVLITVQRAIESYENSKKLNLLRAEYDQLETLHDIVGKSPAMLDLYKLIGRVSEKNITVLITGESGTGKELVTRAIHANSKRKHQKLVSVNIAAIPSELLESELFGYEKGAFTGATTQKKGRFEEAHLGTLHLDEIGDMSPDLQTKLLRIIEEKKFYRLGSESPSPVDVRIIASTNKDLHREVQLGNFREDLYYRLNAITVDIPPLRKRKDDILPLVESFLVKYSDELNVGMRTISDDAKDTLMRYSWPGNVRELENIMKRVLVLSSDSMITKNTLTEAAPYLEKGVVDSAHSFDELVSNELTRLLEDTDDSSEQGIYEIIIKKIEKPLIESTLEITKGNKKKAASILGINRNTLSKKIEELKINEGNGD